MTTMISEVYAAFMEAKVSDATARKAAEAVAAYEARFAGLELQLERLGSRVNVLTWVTGALTSCVLVIGAPSIWLLLRIAAKVSAL